MQSEHHEANVLCALSVALIGPALDALFALPGVVLDDLPASLRTTSLALVVILGAPSIRKDRLFVLEQRGVAGLLLAASAFVGLNAAESTGRNADSIFALVGTLAAVAAVATQGVNRQIGEKLRARVVREQNTAFLAALLFYLGMRTLRHALALPSETLAFKVSHGDVGSPGFAIANDHVVLGNAFAGALTVAFASIVLLNYDLVFRVGSDALATIAGVLGCFVFLGALFAQLAAYTAVDKLPALFSSAACAGSYVECLAAYRARRFFIASNATAVPWTCAISMATFAFSHARRTTSRRAHFMYVPRVLSPEAVAVLVATALALSFVVGFAAEEAVAAGSNATLELALLVLSVPFALFRLPFVACTLHATGQVLYILSRIDGATGFRMTFFTHWSLVATLVLTVVVGALSAFCYSLYAFTPRQRLVCEPLEAVTAVALVALASVQFFLTLGTLGMSAGYTGVGYSSGSYGWVATGYQYTVQHSVSFFFAAALFATRYEHHALSRTLQRVAWFVPPPLLGVAWTATILSVSGGSDPYTEFVDPTSFCVGVSAAAIAWTGCGIAMHV
jgi:hypothetical protein